MEGKTPEELENMAILDISLIVHNDGEWFAAKKAWLAGYKAAMDAKAISLEEPDSSSIRFMNPEPPREVFRICPTPDGFDVKVAEGVTMTEAAETFISTARSLIGTKEG